MNSGKRNERAAPEPSIAMALYVTGMSGLKVSEPVAVQLAGARIRRRQGP